MLREQRYSFSYFCSSAVPGAGGPSLADAHVAEAGAGPYHSVWHHVRLRSTGSAHRTAGRGQLPYAPARSQPQETGAARADRLRAHGHCVPGQSLTLVYLIHTRCTLFHSVKKR